jgi:uncharacterized membrane protein YdjX (TVP38/TMEM64 family)
MAESDPKRTWVSRGAIVALLAGGLLAGAWWFPGQQLLIDLLAWFETAGPIGWLGFAALYTLVTVTLLPTSGLTLGGGFLYGPFTGFLVVWISENLAALVSFWVGRYLARPTVERLVARSALLSALDGAMEDRGFSLLVLIRHSPLAPFGILNYAMSLTGISGVRYTLATLLGTAVPAFAYVYVGSTFAELTDVLQGKSQGDGVQQAVYWGGLVATVVATVGVTWFTRRALAERLDAAGIQR